jgi:intein/homing endonuclease
MQGLWFRNMALNIPQILDGKDIKDLPRFDGQPCLVIGAGPSIRQFRQLEILAKSKWTHPVICADKMLISLLKRKIKPFAVCSVDGEAVISKFYNNSIVDANKDFVRAVLCANTVHPEVLKRCPFEKYFFVSVAEDTPVIVKHKKSKLVDIIPICDIRRRNSNRSPVIRRVTELLVWTERGWSDLKWVGYHTYRGKMLRIYMPNATVDVTPTHSLLDIDGKIIEAEKVTVGQALMTQRVPESEGITKVEPDVAWLYGLFAAEGHANIRERKSLERMKKKKLRKPEKVYSWCITNTNKSLLLKAAKILLKYFGVRTRINKTKGKPHMFKGRIVYPKEPIWCLTCEKAKIMAISFRDAFYTKDGYKKVPKVILNSDRKAMLAFLRGFNVGDGRTTDYKGRKDHQTLRNLSTSSKTLAMGLYFLIKNTTKQRVNMTYDERNPNLMILDLNLTHNPRYRKIPDGVVKKIVPIDYEGWVYDVETESHNFVAGIGELVVHNSIWDNPLNPTSLTRAFHLMTGKTMLETYGNAGSCAFSIAYFLGCDPIGLLGLDYSYYTNDVRKTTYYESLKALSGGDTAKLLSFYKRTRTWAGYEVLTDIYWLTYLQMFLPAVEKAKADIYNLSPLSIIASEKVKGIDLKEFLERFNRG